MEVVGFRRSRSFNYVCYLTQKKNGPTHVQTIKLTLLNVLAVFETREAGVTIRLAGVKMPLLSMEQTRKLEKETQNLTHEFRLL